ncbi:MAG: MopE-related protein [Pseudomonadota bacterium]|nr:MopE-related protein [Pseudomonadota bacterium]
MSKSVLLALTLPLGILAGCGREGPQYLEIEYPIMTLGQASLEFGEAEWGGTVERTIILGNDGGMPMGVGTILIGDEGEGSAYTVTWNTANIECPEVATDTAAASAKGVDTGSEPVDTGGTGGDDTGDGGGGVVVEGALFLLDPGCQIPLVVTFTPNAQGDAYDALVVESVGTVLTPAQEDAGQYLPDFKEDPVHTRQVVYLHGEAQFEQGSVVVRPRSYDFGYVHPDAADSEAPARIQISNVGDGDVTITGAELSTTCDLESFFLDPHFLPGWVLSGESSTLAEVTFTPTDSNASYCQLFVYTDDPANPTVDVTLTGNSGTDPENVPPTVYVRSPENGYRYSTIRPLTIELNIFDENQPATSLTCKIKSSLGEATVANCAADEESGHVFVDIPADDLTAGVDTLLVTVTDGSSTSAYASVSVVINAEYPADDDDGDGYGVAVEPIDCDDTNILTYPDAAEVYDLQDNNCDGRTDEGTEGYDDDGDSVTELDGDCNDYSEDVYPGAPERGDGMDNDCDGTSDETTSLHDDDGDGYAEVNNDCNDNDATVNPSAAELCDGVDNDCDGLRDSADGCEATDSDPVIVGDNIRMEQSACLEFEVITMDVMVFDADQDTITYQWSTDEGGGTFDNNAAQVVNYTAPEIAGDTANSGKAQNIYAVVFDADGHQDWAFGRLAVWDDNTELYDPFTKAIIQEEKGCSSSGGTPTGALVLAGAALALAFRRRE